MSKKEKKKKTHAHKWGFGWITIEEVKNDFILKCGGKYFPNPLNQCPMLMYPCFVKCQMNLMTSM